MKVIDTRVHGILDYVMGAALIASPWILDFADGSAAQWVPVAVGATMIPMSLITNYELGVAKVVPMPAHLTVDLLSGILLASSPWLFGFSDRVYLPHLILGLMEIAAAMLTERTPRHIAKQQTVGQPKQKTAQPQTH